MKKQNLLKRFAGYYKPHLKLFIIDMCCAFLISAFNLVYPSVTQRIISRFVPQKELEIMLAVLAALLVFYVIKAALNFVLQYWGHMVGVRIQSDMRRELFDHIQKLPFKYFEVYVSQNGLVEGQGDVFILYNVLFFFHYQVYSYNLFILYFMYAWSANTNTSHIAMI